MNHLGQTLVHQNAQFLKENKLRLVALSFVAATLFSVSLPLGSTLASRNRGLTNHNNIVSATETRHALGTTGVLSDSDQIVTKTDADSAAVTNINGSTVDIPKDATQGVTFGAEGQTLDIQLPNANTAALAKQAAPGITTYDSGNGSANAIQPTEDGGIRMLTIIDNPNAPTSYDYKVSVPKGGRIELSPDGGATIFNRKQKPIAAVATPWAKDATGKAVRAHFTTDGRTLTQHVQHDVPGVVYPVSADPFWIAFSGAIFWYAVKICVKGVAFNVVVSYVGGQRSRQALQGAAAAGCLANILGGWSKVRWMMYIYKVL